MTSKEVGETLFKLRKERGLSLRELSSKIGNNIAHLSRMENGITYPSVETICKLCDFYEIKIQAFFDLVETYKTKN